MSEPYRFARETTDPGEASEVLRAADGAFEFTADPGSRFRFSMEQFGDAAVSVGRYAIDGAWRSEGVFDGFCVSTVTGGRMDWEHRGERGVASGSSMLVRPDEPHVFECADLRIANVYLGADELTQVAHVLYGRDDVTVDFESPHLVHPRYAAHWRTLVALADDAVATGAFEHALVRTSLVRNLAIATLESFRLVGDPDERRLSAADQERRYRAAVRFMDDFASLPITPLDVAAAIDCTLPQLERAFAAHAMASPGDYLERVRLAAAHADLVRGDPARGPAVELVAHRWGFADVQLFRRRYREVYGRSPSATLRA